MSASLSNLLADGELLSVVQVAEKVLGSPVTTQSVLRWCTAGRRGVRLPSLRGSRSRRVTTVACFRAWLEATSEPLQVAQTQAKGDAVADAVLESFGLGECGRRKGA